MKEKRMTTITLKKMNRDKVYQYIYQQKRNFQTSDCSGSSDGTFHRKSEFKTIWKPAD